jgi:HEAT repeat protein
MKSCFDGDKEATAAVRQIGTNAVPSLTQWLLYEPSKIRLNLIAATWKLPRKIQTALWDIGALVGDRHWNVRNDLALYGFSLLGPQAQPAIPDLVRALVNHEAPGANLNITRVLRTIGEDSLPPLVTVMTNRANPAELRVDAVRWIRSTHIFNSFAVSNLVDCLQNQQSEVAVAAAFALADSKFEPDVVLPFLTNAVHSVRLNERERREAVDYINEYGQVARPAVPALVELMADPSDRVRDSVTNALSNIAPELLNQATPASN